MEKKYLIMLDGQHEYTITDTTNKKGHRVITLFYSEADFWRLDLQGKEILRMIDNGDSVKLSKISKKMDYGQLAELRLLLSFSKATDDNPIEREGCYVYVALENSASGESFKI